MTPAGKMSPMTQFHIAQINIALGRAPVIDPLLAEFVAQLDAVNALADASPGFVWRLQDESGDATSIQAFDDARMIVNVTVWQSIEALFDFTYRSAHTEVLKRRAEWFELPDGPHIALWWIAAGHIPTLEEALSRLEHLRGHGPTADAFTIKRRFPIPIEAEKMG